MNEELFLAIELIEKEKGIKAGNMIEKIKAAFVSALKNTYGDENAIIVDIDPEAKTMRVAVRFTVVEDEGEEVYRPATQITLDQGRAMDANAQIGSVIEKEIDPKALGRILTNTIKSVIHQGIREEERNLSDQVLRDNHGEVVTAKVIEVYTDTGDARVEIGKSEGNKAVCTLKKGDQIPGEELLVGQLIKVYVIESRQESEYDRPSRTHPQFVARRFESEVPEISDGTVQIKGISREAGSRTKISVYSQDEKVDPVGACIGPKGQRVSLIVSELCGEKIDVVRYDEDPEKYIAAALAPAEVTSVQILEQEGMKSCRVIVPDNQLSLAIGNKGQNVRLAARLTGWKIDIKPQSQA